MTLGDSAKPNKLIGKQITLLGAVSVAGSFVSLTLLRAAPGKLSQG